MKTGIDIGAHRLDDLDREIVRASLALPFETQTIVNLGSGASILSLTLALLGHRVYNYDKRDVSQFFNTNTVATQRLFFRTADIRKIKKHELPKPCHTIVAQRVLHHLRYEEALKLLGLCAHVLEKGGTLALSFSGLDSALREGYQAGTHPVETRWGRVSPEDQEAFEIDGEICLYGQDEVAHLIEQVGRLKITKLWTSDFGNHKCICRKK